MGLASVLFVVFFVLKLTGNIDWSWVWVTAPLWGSVVLVLLGTLVAVVAASGMSANAPFRR